MKDLKLDPATADDTVEKMMKLTGKLAKELGVDVTMQIEKMKDGSKGLISLTLTQQGGRHEDLASVQIPRIGAVVAESRFAAGITRPIQKEMTVGDAMHQIGRAARSRK